MPEKRPTREDIERLLQWAGGGFDHVPYVASDRPVVETASGYVSLESPSNFGGFWAPYWSGVVDCMRFMRQEIEEEVRKKTTEYFPENFDIRIPPTCPNKVGDAINQLTFTTPVVRVEGPDGWKPDAERRTIEAKLSKAATAWLVQENKQSDTGPLWEQSENTMGLGLGARQVLLLMELMPDEPERRDRDGEDEETFKDRKA